MMIGSLPNLTEGENQPLKGSMSGSASCSDSLDAESKLWRLDDIHCRALLCLGYIPGRMLQCLPPS
jgi:hypothetical protein